MYENSAGSQAQVLVATSNEQINIPFGDAFSGAGSELIKRELGAYGEKILGSGSAYVQSNISRYFSNPRYYFQVNDEYVKNKLKVVLFPFLHKGNWMRATEMVGGKFSYKPPIYDINAPDLYIPLMSFGTYVVLAGFFLGISGKFSPEALGVQFANGLLCWLLQVLLLEATLQWLGGCEAAALLLDMVSYGGYTFVGASVIVAARIVWRSDQYTSFCAVLVVTLWECFCMGVLLVKIMKRILIEQVMITRSCDYYKHCSTTKRHYLLLLMVFAQFPLLFWLGSVGV